MKYRKQNPRPENRPKKLLRLKISSVNAMEMPRGMDFYVEIEDKPGEKK